MAATIRSTLVAAVAVALTVACTAPAEAQFRFRLRPTVRVTTPVVVTTPTVSYPVPYLGFDSFFDGSGEQLTVVQHGAAAWRIGLEPGDIILAVNRVPIRYHGHGLQLLQAASRRGRVSLTIHDSRTGLVTHRTIRLKSRAATLSSTSYGVVSYGVHTHHRVHPRIPRRFPY